MEPLSVISLFAGVGMQEIGIKNSGCFDLKTVAISEINKYATVSYAAIHHELSQKTVDSYAEYPSKKEMTEDLKSRNIVQCGSNMRDIKKFWLATVLSNNLGDIKRIKSIPQCDLVTFTFPCTDISTQGKQMGFDIKDWKNGNCTRSGMVWEVLRLLDRAKDDNTLPKYLLMENVSNITSPKHIRNFDLINESISNMGYNYYFKKLNSKDCGVPQNRERMFVVYIRKDIDKRKFEFPVPFTSRTTVKDILDENPDEKYYFPSTVQRGFKANITNTSNCGLCGNVPNKYVSEGRVYRPAKIYHTITTHSNSNKILTKSKNKADVVIREILDRYGEISGYEVCDKSIKNPKIREIANAILRRYDNGIANIQSSGTAVICNEDNAYRIRKLTPCECFKLMGVSESDYRKIADIGISDAQAYCQAGNGVVTECVKLIMQHLYKAQYDPTFVCDDEKQSDAQG